MLALCPIFAFGNTGGDEDCDSENTEICVEQQDVELPKVFLIGEYAEEFDAASAEYSLQLIDACKKDMNIAYIKWLSMLQEMENYAETLGFEIKGVKMWVKVFWDTNGTIDHIAYYLKPHSRNVDVNELTAFFMSFMNQYEFPLIAEEKFSNYGSAAFPIVTRRKSSTTKKMENNNDRASKD